MAFEVRPGHADESFEEGLAAEEIAVSLAERKALAVAADLRARDLLVIGADTVVAVESDGATRILGKPEGVEEARGMLGLLSASRHRVVTGVCVVRSNSYSMPRYRR